VAVGPKMNFVQGDILEILRDAGLSSLLRVVGRVLNACVSPGCDIPNNRRPACISWVTAVSVVVRVRISAAVLVVVWVASSVSHADRGFFGSVRSAGGTIR
jgi:hypothetical protein